MQTIFLYFSVRHYLLCLASTRETRCQAHETTVNPVLSGTLITLYMYWLSHIQQHKLL